MGKFFVILYHWTVYVHSEKNHSKDMKRAYTAKKPKAKLLYSNFGTAFTQARPLISHRVIAII
jgi:hypothetical protein